MAPPTATIPVCMALGFTATFALGAFAYALAGLAAVAVLRHPA